MRQPSDTYKSFRDFIRIESDDNYNVIVGGAEVPLTEMTIGEVLRYQAKLQNEGRDTSAGAYQIKLSTLQSIIKRDPDTFSTTAKFDERIQNLAADNLIDERVRRANIDVRQNNRTFRDAFLDQLSKEWAGLPVVRDMQGSAREVKRGESYYSGVGNNRALTEKGATPEELERQVDIIINPSQASAQNQKPEDPKVQPGLFERLLEGVDIQPYSEGHSETKYGDDSPTGEPIIYVNDDLYKGNAKTKMTKAESLHLLKLKEPELYQSLMDEALNDPEYMASARHSFDVVRGLKPDENGNIVPEEKRETRPFEQWHTVSHFDQVLGGYILAQDPDFPTMKNFNRDEMSLGPGLREKFETIRQEFNSPTNSQTLQNIVPTQRGQIPLPSGPDGFVPATSLGNLRIEETEQQIASVPTTQMGSPDYFSPSEEEAEIALESDSFELSPMKPKTEVKPASEIYSNSILTQGVQALQQMLKPQRDISDVLPFIPPPTREKVTQLATVDDRTPERIAADESFKTYYEHHKRQRRERLAGRTRSALAGATFRWNDELESLIRYESKKARGVEGSYQEELDYVRGAQDRYERLHFGESLLFEGLGAVPSSFGLTSALGKGLMGRTVRKQREDIRKERIARGELKGPRPGTFLAGRDAKGRFKKQAVQSPPIDFRIQNPMGQFYIEGGIYGAGSGDTFEERAFYGTVGSLSGLGLGKVTSMMSKGTSSGGLRTQADEVADQSIPATDDAVNLNLERAKDNEIYVEVDNPRYTQKPLSEAQTVGELWTGLTGALRNFYNDKMTGLSDRLGREVSNDVMGRYQRGNQAALRITNNEMEQLSKDMVPVIQVVNEDEAVKGALLDYGAGYFLTQSEIASYNSLLKGLQTSTDPLDYIKKLKRRRAELQEVSIKRLEKHLAEKLNTANMEALKRYLRYSDRKQLSLNKNVFGADFETRPGSGNFLTYLTTRNRAVAEQRVSDGAAFDAVEAQSLMDSAFKPRTRGRYIQQADYTGPRPNPADYDNPIVTDMKRIQKLEELNQVGRAFGVRPQTAAEVFGRPITIDEFYDELAYTMRDKGISQEGSFYAMNLMREGMLGAAKAPHPLIQAASSLAYAVTLAGPLSAILNLADIPLLGAKYGGSAVKEGLKAAGPFKAIPNVDLQKLGIGNQTFGEFMNLINENASMQQGWMARTAEKMRNTADFLMKGSGFAAMDQVGKKGVIRGILKSAADDAAAGKLADNWGFYFNPEELRVISNGFKKHGQDWRKYTGKEKELIEELMFAGLGQQQLISSAGRPSAWARNPNLRPLWALRGFVVKQQALALREVMGNLKAGKPAEAAKFLGRYAAYGAGGYAVINEGRQYIFGDGEASFSGMARGYGDAWASLLTANTLGLNDYQYGLIKQYGILPTFALGMMPIALTRPFDIAGTTINVLDQKESPAALAAEIPVIRDIGRITRNIGELTENPVLMDIGETATRKSIEQE